MNIKTIQKISCFIICMSFLTYQSSAQLTVNEYNNVGINDPDKETTDSVSLFIHNEILPGSSFNHGIYNKLTYEPPSGSSYSYSENESKTGMTNFLDINTKNEQTAVKNIITSKGKSNKIGLTNSITQKGNDWNNFAIGVENNIVEGVGKIYGIHQNLEHIGTTANKEVMGIKNDFLSEGLANIYGMNNLFQCNQSGNTASIYGLRNEFQDKNNQLNNHKFGVVNVINGRGYKIGFKNYMRATDGGWRGLENDIVSDSHGGIAIENNITSNGWTAIIKNTLTNNSTSDNFFGIDQNLQPSRNHTKSAIGIRNVIGTVGNSGTIYGTQNLLTLSNINRRAGTSFGAYNRVTNSNMDGVSFGTYNEIRVNAHNQFNIAVTGVVTRESGFNTTLGGTQIGVLAECIPNEAEGYAAYFSGHSVNLNGASLLGSDRRFKKEINNLEDASSIIQKLDGTSYKLKSDTNQRSANAEKLHYGFIAQDVKKVLPDLVYEIPYIKSTTDGKINMEDDKYLAINYNGVIPILVEAHKELTAKNEVIIRENKSLKSTLEKTIAAQTEMLETYKALEKKIEILQAQVQAIDNCTDCISESADVLYMSKERITEDRGTLVYPNPATDQVVVETKGIEGEYSIHVIDMQGRILSTTHSEETMNVVKTGHLAAGTYIVRVEQDGELIKNHEIVIQRL